MYASYADLIKTELYCLKHYIENFRSANEKSDTCTPPTFPSFRTLKYVARVPLWQRHFVPLPIYLLYGLHVSDSRSLQLHSLSSDQKIAQSSLLHGPRFTCNVLNCACKTESKT